MKSKLTACVEAARKFLGHDFNPRGCGYVPIIGIGSEENNEEALRNWVRKYLYNKIVLSDGNFDISDMFRELRNDIFEKMCVDY